MSSQYAFFAGILRFVARKTAAEDPEIRVMMGHLSGIADAVEKTGRFMVLRENCESWCYAFSKVAFGERASWTMSPKCGVTDHGVEIIKIILGEAAR